jgi:hypothetical protein
MSSIFDICKEIELFPGRVSELFSSVSLKGIASSWWAWFTCRLVPETSHSVMQSLWLPTCTSLSIYRNLQYAEVSEKKLNRTRSVARLSVRRATPSWANRTGRMRIRAGEKRKWQKARKLNSSVIKRKEREQLMRWSLGRVLWHGIIWIFAFCLCNDWWTNSDTWSELNCVENFTTKLSWRDGFLYFKRMLFCYA